MWLTRYCYMVSVFLVVSLLLPPYSWQWTLITAALALGFLAVALLREDGIDDNDED